MLESLRKLASRSARVTTPARGTILLVIAQGALLLSGFVVSIILARGLGPESFGVYGVVISLLGWLERVLSAGIPGAAATLIPRDQSKQAAVERSARLILVIWSLPLFALVWMVAPALAQQLNIPSGASLFRIAALNIPAMSLYFAYQGILSGRRLFGTLSSVQILQSVSKVAGILVLLAIGLSLPGALVSHVVATMVTIAIVTTAFPLGRAPASRTAMRSVIGIALPMTVYSISLAVLLNLSLWQLKAGLSGEGASVGLYVAGLNLTKILMVVPATTSGVLFVSLSWALASSRHDLAAKYVQEAGRFALVIAVPACVLLWIDAEPIVQLLYGAQYAGGGAILRVLCIAFGAVAILDILFHALMATGRLRSAASVLGALLPILFILNRILIQSSGALGAATASMIVLCFGAAIAAILAHRRFGVVFRWVTIVRVTAAGTAIWAVSTWIAAAGAWIVIKLGGLFLLYLLILWMIGELSKQDLKPFALWKRQES